MTEAGLFHMPTQNLMNAPVVVQTMWGDEHGLVVDVTYEAGFPMAQVQMELGDTISIGVARLKRRDPE